ncbi:MAG: SOS response-associated peptidase family protein, partial [Saprospiraceae bacterium]
ADSFYEWRKEGSRKLPYRIRYKNGEMMFLAGIWEEWRRGEERKRTFSIVTSGANTDMNDLHDRMPVLLTTEAQRQEWLFGSPEDALQQLANPTPDGLLEKYRVSTKLNTPYYDEPDLHDPALADEV